MFQGFPLAADGTTIRTHKRGEVSISSLKIVTAPTALHSCSPWLDGGEVLVGLLAFQK
jgi:hypothetical protein